MARRTFAPFKVTPAAGVKLDELVGLNVEFFTAPPVSGSAPTSDLANVHGGPLGVTLHKIGPGGVVFAGRWKGPDGVATLYPRVTDWQGQHSVDHSGKTRAFVSRFAGNPINETQVDAID